MTLTRRYASVVLATLPVMSFALQLSLSRRAGTVTLMLQHPTVMLVDWILVPFNYYAARVVDWSRGVAIYVSTVIALALNVMAHAYWQYAHLDPGHMISSQGVTLPAGWVHLVFASLETVLMIAFVFVARRGSADRRPATVFAVAYFFAMAVAGYRIHGRLIIGDVVASVSGLLLVTLYERVRYARWRRTI